MSPQQLIKISICIKYERLSEECEKAWASWKKLRGETSQSLSVTKETGEELLHLQENYARAYLFLQNHAPNCSLCQLVARVDARDSKISSAALSCI